MTGNHFPPTERRQTKKTHGFYRLGGTGFHPPPPRSCPRTPYRTRTRRWTVGPQSWGRTGSDWGRPVQGVSACPAQSPANHPGLPSKWAKSIYIESYTVFAIWMDNMNDQSAYRKMLFVCNSVFLSKMVLLDIFEDLGPNVGCTVMVVHAGESEAIPPLALFGFILTLFKCVFSRFAYMFLEYLHSRSSEEWQNNITGGVLYACCHGSVLGLLRTCFLRHFPSWINF